MKKNQKTSCACHSGDGCKSCKCKSLFLILLVLLALAACWYVFHQTSVDQQAQNPQRAAVVQEEVVLVEQDVADEAAPAGDETTALARARISILHASGADPSVFEVEEALTPEEQAHGMMFRRDVPQGTGMVFRFEAPRVASFWMKNTPVPLDIIFFDEQGLIVKIIANATPESEEPLVSDVPVIGALEIGGGEAERLGIVLGDSIQ
ncbi:MAG: DUF192 domain-containing protein [Alphaproteobacteria bacterium]|nr:DUF192 domain-containing protein [Alphaproteobacteria bacterium]